LEDDSETHFQTYNTRLKNTFGSDIDSRKVGSLTNVAWRQATLSFEFRGRESGVNRKGIFQPSGSLQQTFQPLSDVLECRRVC
jgi:hypothetical protein